MAPKKAAAKKAAKKAAGRPDHHHAAKDARRAFEHLARVQALHSLTATKADTVSLLTKLADTAFRAEHYKASADLLRTAEHLSFADVSSKREDKASPELKSAVEEEIVHLGERMEHHASEHSIRADLETLMRSLQQDAMQALHHGHLHTAMELARAAEALAHVHDLEDTPGLEQTKRARLQSGR